MCQHASAPSATVIGMPALDRLPLQCKRLKPAVAGHGWAVWAALLCVGLVCTVPRASAAGEAMRWQALFDALPGLPATPAEASKMVSARPVTSDGLGIVQLRIEVADARLRALQQQADALYEPTARASASQFKRAMEAANKDPAVTELARTIEKTWQPDPSRPDKLPSPEALREIERVLGPMPAPSSATASRSEIAAYRRELQSATPRAAQFLQRLLDQQRAYATRHAQADREPHAAAPALVAQHHALAQQQLNDAAEILAQAREALAPRVQRFAELARASEQRDAPPGERNEAYAQLKAYIEFLLTLQRETLQDVGFWGATRAAATPLRYELSLAPGFNLRANGETLLSLPHYPIGRAIVVGLPPGIR